jgi:pyruvate dehydrogenase E1 component beta subunit
VSKTRRLVTVEENQFTGGWGTGIVSDIASSAFGEMDAPPIRITAPDVHVPYGTELEERFLPSVEYMTNQITSLIKTGVVPKKWWEEEL